MHISDYFNAASYRVPMRIIEIRLYRTGSTYPVCPRCRTTLEREYQAYCDRCGQCLDWRDYEQALVIM